MLVFRGVDSSKSQKKLGSDICWVFIVVLVTLGKSGSFWIPGVATSCLPDFESSAACSMSQYLGSGNFFEESAWCQRDVSLSMILECPWRG